MKLLPAIVLLPICLFGALAAIAAPCQKPPASEAALVPRQTYRVEAQANLGTRNQSVSEHKARNWSIAVTPRVIAVGLHDYGNQPVGVAAFDRGTGRELWRKERTADAGTNGSAYHSPALNGGKLSGTGLFGSDVPGADLTPRLPQTNYARAAWWLTGAVSRQDGSAVIVVISWNPAPNPAGRQPDSEAELHGIEADTGRELWQIPLSESRSEDRSRPIGIYGSVIALVPDDQIYNAKTQRMERREGGNQANFLNAFTGQPILPSTPEGKAALKQACEQYGSSFALSFAMPDRPRLLRLDTGTVQPLDTPRGYASLVGVTASRGVILVNMDDDYAGHSVWPHYVYGADAAGKQVWQFSTHILLPGMDFDLATGKGFPTEKGQVGRDFEDVAEAQVIAAANTVIVSSSTPYQAQKRKTTGLRATDGRVLWRNPAGAIRFLRPYEWGCFALMESGQLLYIDAQTGQQQSCGKLPDCANFLVAGKEMFTVHSDGTIAAYDLPRLIPPIPVPVPRARPVTPRRKKRL